MKYGKLEKSCILFLNSLYLAMLLIDEQKFSEIFHTVRRRRGLDQADVAKLIGVSRQAVNGFENGKAPSRRHLKKIIEVFPEILEEA